MAKRDYVISNHLKYVCAHSKRLIHEHLTKVYFEWYELLSVRNRLGKRATAVVINPTTLQSCRWPSHTEPFLTLVLSSWLSIVFESIAVFYLRLSDRELSCTPKRYPCSKTGKCVYNESNPAFQCTCPRGLLGKTCQTGKTNVRCKISENIEN